MSRFNHRLDRAFTIPTSTRRVGLWCGVAGFLLASGCTRISVAPTCPSALGVGESGSVDSNEMTPGSIATYAWEVFPSTAGTFADAARASTTFEADAPGSVILQVTASDGLFVVTGQCRTRIGAVAVVVELSAQPASVVEGDPVTLTCASVGDTEAVTFRFEQTGGTTVLLASTSPGVATATTTVAGDLTFQCVGVGAGGSESAPSTVTISVGDAPTDSGGGRGGRP